MSKTYHVYGLGNALVDMEFEVTPEQLQDLQIDKGVMTLVDEQRQGELVQQLQAQAGKRSCGGSAANTMVALSQLGGKGFYSCKIADDETGKFYLQDLKDCGLHTNLHDSEHDQGITGKCLVLVTPDADRTMNTFLGISGNLAEKELDKTAITESEYLYLEGYLVTSPTAKQAAISAREIAKEAGVKTTLSLSDPNMAEYFQDGLLEMIGDGLDFIFANEAEAMTMAKTDNMNGAIDYLKGLTKCFAITQGAKGSVIFDGQEMLEIPAFPVEAVDTVGAGDMYAGAFLYGITHGMGYFKAGKLASLASSKIVTTFGPRLETETLQGLVKLV
ncbi:MAG: adenosine kinase [Microcystaceae cyanobacterium]